MKTKTISLDVDLIGSGVPPTPEELKMISEAIKADREKRLRSQARKGKQNSPSKEKY